MLLCYVEVVGMYGEPMNLHLAVTVVFEYMQLSMTMFVVIAQAIYVFCWGWLVG